MTGAGGSFGPCKDLMECLRRLVFYLVLFLMSRLHGSNQLSSLYCLRREIAFTGSTDCFLRDLSSTTGCQGCLSEIKRLGFLDYSSHRLGEW